MAVPSKPAFMPLTARSAADQNYPLPATRQSRARGSLCLVAMAAAALTGCADLRWHKNGTDAATLERDLGECQQQARAEAVRESWSHGPGSPIVGVDAQGRAILSQPGRVDTDRFLMEHDLERFCMRKRGYELVPAKKQ